MSDHDFLNPNGPGDSAALSRTSPDVPPHIASVLEMITDGFIALDDSDHYVYINHQAEAMLGRSRKELLGLNIWEAFPGEASSEFGRAVARARADDAQITCSNHAATLDQWFESQIYPSPDGLLFVYFRVITEVKRAHERSSLATEALRLRERAVEAVSNGIIICDARQRDCPIVYANPAFYTLTGYPPQEVIGRNCRFLQGEGTDATALQELRDCLRAGQGCRVVLKNYRKDGTAFWNELTISPVRDSGGELTHFIGAQTDVSAQVEVQLALRQSEERYRQQVDEFQTLFDMLPVAVLVADDPQCRSIRANPAGQRLLTVSPDANVSMSAEEEQKTDAFRVMRDGREVPPDQLPMQVAAATGHEVVGIECHIVRSDGSESDIYGFASPLFDKDGGTRGSIGAFLDVAPMKRLEAELRAQAERLSQMGAYSHAIVEALAEGVIVQDARGVLTSANSAAELLLGLSVEGMAGRISADPRWEAVRDDGTDFPADEHPPIVALRTGQPVSGVVMGLARPDGTRVWLSLNSMPITHPDTGELQGVVSSFFDITVMRQALRDQQARVEREALLRRVGQALRSETEPERVLETAVKLLGEALLADRCYYATYDLDDDTVNLACDWHPGGLTTIRGTYRFSNSVQMFSELDCGANTWVVTDTLAAPLSTETIANMKQLGLRSVVSATLVDRGGFTAALTAAMVDVPRVWTEEEVELVRDVATLVRVTVEAAQVTQREHRLAVHFQSAIQPTLPISVPGMALASFYRPAWEDHGVGGDFLDVFTAETGVAYLVVGDLSGKGLDAASQVSMVRHILRFAVLNSTKWGRSLAEEITRVGNTLSTHEMLRGFATLFVGRYNAGTQTLTYVNCGQDAGLILRNLTGQVETLPPTGPVLGFIEEIDYTEETVSLAVGDALVLYTDGLTEVGESRLDLLMEDGLAALLREQAGIDDAQKIAQRLMAGVDAYGGTGIRDDQCLLVGVVTSDSDF